MSLSAGHCLQVTLWVIVTLMKSFLVAESNFWWMIQLLSHQQPTLLSVEKISVSDLNRVVRQSTTMSSSQPAWSCQLKPEPSYSLFQREREFCSGDVHEKGISLSRLGPYWLCDGGGGDRMVKSSIVVRKSSPQKEYRLHRPKKKPMSTIAFYILWMRKHIHKWWVMIQKSLWEIIL